VIKACIFDLDGVIVDTAHYHFLAWKRLASELNIELTEKDNEKLKGVSRMQSLDIILALGNVTFAEHEKERLAQKKNEWFIEYIEKMTPDEIFPGAIPLIKQLKKEGLKVGLASSSKNAKTIIGLLRLENDFEVVVDGTMVVHTKPDPEIFLLAATKLGVEPKHCLIFEDAEAGVEAAIAAGMRCIGIGSPALLGKANKVIAGIGEFNPSMLHEVEEINT
jgi:beta-phosphoglucomutase